MTAGFKGLTKIFKSPLSLRIVFWVFVCVIAIETIIFIPSYNNRKKERLSLLKEVSLARITTVCHLNRENLSDEDILHELKMLRRFFPLLIGGTLYKTDGQKIGDFGTPPPVSFSEIKNRGFIELNNKNRYQMVFSAGLLQNRYTLIAGIEAVSVKSDLNAFALRIAGLVIIISIFVTAGAWIALYPLVVTPILKLRQDLIHAGEAIQKDEQVPVLHAASIRRRDELGDVISAFMKMFQQIIDAVTERKRAEKLLQESLRQVQEYSAALNSELEQGLRIQQDFFPSQLPQIPGWEFSAFFKPARKVAGDFYDVFELPSNQVGIVIADVCDKGVGAALFMGLFRSLIRIFSGQTILKGLVLPNNKPPHTLENTASNKAAADSLQENALQAVRLTNNYIAQNHGDLGMFATLFFGVLNPATGVLAYINGGHEPPFLVGTNGGKKRLDPNGPAVGIIADHTFNTSRVDLEPGDILIGYTDGISEALSSDGKLFTKDRLESLVEQSVTSAADLLNRIRISVSAHTKNAEQEDDITLLAIQRVPLTNRNKRMR